MAKGIRLERNVAQVEGIGETLALMKGWPKEANKELRAEVQQMTGRHAEFLKANAARHPDARVGADPLRTDARVAVHLLPRRRAHHGQCDIAAHRRASECEARWAKLQGRGRHGLDTVAVQRFSRHEDVMACTEACDLRPPQALVRLQPGHQH